MSTVNYFEARRSNLATFNAVRLNVSTMTGSTIQTSATATTSSVVVSSLQIQSATYSTLGGSSLSASTLQTQNATYSTLSGSNLSTSTLSASTIRSNTLTLSTISTSSIMTTGNVGIGTTLPASQLTVHGGNTSTAITVANGYNAANYSRYGLAYSASQYSNLSVAGDTVINAVGGNMILEAQNKNISLSVPTANGQNTLTVSGTGAGATSSTAGWGSLTNTFKYNNIALTWTAPVACYVSSVSMYLGQGNNGTNISMYLNGNFINEWWPFQGYGLYVINATGSSTANGAATTPTPFSAMGQTLLQAGQTLTIYISSLQAYNYFYYGRDNTTGGIGFSVVYTSPQVSMSLSSTAPALSLGSNGVGIGASAPLATLDVNGSIRALSATYNALTSGTGVDIIYSGGGTLSSGTRGAGGVLTAATMAYAASGHTWYVGSSAGTNAMTVASTGRLGVGTAAPRRVVDIVGPPTNPLTYAPTQLSVSDTAGSAMMNLLIGVDGTSNYASIQSSQSGVGGRPLLLNATEGNVGIGTSNPGSLLSVYGSSTAYSGLINIQNTTTVGASSFAILAPNLIAGQGHSMVIGQNTSPNNSFFIFFQYTSAGSASNYLCFSPYGSGANSLVITNSSNVGIGTTTPGYALDVIGSARASGSLIFGASGSYLAGCIYSDANWGCIIRAKTVNPNTAAFLFSNSADTHLMAITNSGFVGIGTDTPPAWGQTTICGAGNSVNSSNQLVLMNSSNTNMVLMSAMGTSAAYIQSFQQGSGGATLCLNQLGGNVGIGMTNPGYALDVVGTGRATSGLVAGNGTTAVALQLLDLPTASWKITTGDYNLSIQNNSSSWTNRLVINQNGLVGIGTTNPGYTLDVVGNARISTGIAIAGANVINLGYDQTKETNAGKIGYQTFTSGALDIIGAGTANNGTRLVKIWDNLTVSNKLGIGTNTPSYLLHVHNGGAYQTHHLIISGQEFYQASNSSTGIALNIGVNRVGNKQLWFMDPDLAINTTNAAIRYSLGSTTAYIGAISTDGTTSVPLSLSGSSISLATGNVGIGITNPSFPLSLIGTQSINGTTGQYSKTTSSGNLLFNTSSDSYAYPTMNLFNYDHNNSGIFFDIIYTNPNWQNCYSGTNWGIYKSSGILQFAYLNGTAGTTGSLTNAMVLTSSGVGIGTTNPFSKLNIAGGNIQLGSSSEYENGTTCTEVILFGGSYAANWTYGYAGIQGGCAGSGGGGGYGGVLNFWTKVDNSSSYVGMTLNRGNVGIGTTDTQNNKLRVFGGNSISGISIGDHLTSAGIKYIGMTNPTNGTAIGLDNGFSGMTFGPANDGATSGYVALHTHYYGVNSGERMRIDKSGNVGIGLTNPSYLLHVAGSLNCSSLYVNGVSITSLGAKWTESGSNAYYTAGNIGIGTTSPSNLLTVAQLGSNYSAPVLILDAGIPSNATAGAPRGIGKPLLGIGNSSWTSGGVAGDYYGIGFGYGGATSGSYFPAEIGLYVQTTSGSTWGDLVFSTRSTTANNVASERLRITGAGNIGIGKNNPSYLLDVAGPLNCTGLYVNGSVFTGGSGATWTISGSNAYYTTGNIGIGTASPGAKLDIYSSATNQSAVNIGVAGEAYSLTPSAKNQYYTAGTIAAIYTSATSTNNGCLIDLNAYNSSNGATDVYFGAVAGATGNGPANFVIGRRTGVNSWAESVRVDTSGNLGIGTASPTENLTVYGSAIGLRNSSAGVFSIGLATGSGQYSSSAVSADSIIRSMNGNLLLQTGSGAAALSINNSTNYVGIGTTAPSTALTVVGSATIQGQLFSVGGNTSTYYPVLIDAGPSWTTTNIYKFNISRSNVHMDASWKGSTTIVVEGHNYNWGNGADYMKYKIIGSTSGPVSWGNFVANIFEDSTSAFIVIYLRGGTTYYFSGEGCLLNNGNASGATLTVPSGAGASYASTTSITAPFGSLVVSGDYRDNIWSVGGNVGIGKSNPTQLLDVNGAINCTSFLVNGTAVATGTGSVWGVNGSAAYYTSGYVGVGTNNPLNTNPNFIGTNGGNGIDVWSTTAFDAWAKIRILCNASQYGRTALEMIGRWEGNNDGWTLNGGRNNIVFGYQTSQGSAITYVNAIQSFNGQLGFFSSGYSTAVPALTLGSGGFVGIGTTTPAVSLHIYGSSTAGYQNRIQIEGNANDVACINLKTAANTSYIFTDGSGNLQLYPSTPASQRIFIQPNPSGRVAIGNNGNNPLGTLQIGTGSGSVACDGTIVIGKTNGATSYRNFKMGYDVDYNFAFGDFNDGSTWTQHMKFSYMAPANCIVVNSSGYVGIGTATPSVQLHVNGATLIQGPTVSTNTANNVGNFGVRISQLTSTQNVAGQIVGQLCFHGWGRPYASSYIRCMTESSNGYDDAGALVFGTSNGGNGASETMRISESGNVGIGITTPSTKLHVVGGTTTDSLLVSGAPISTGLTVFSGPASNTYTLPYGAGLYFLYFHYGNPIANYPAAVWQVFYDGFTSAVYTKMFSTNGPQYGQITSASGNVLTISNGGAWWGYDSNGVLYVRVTKIC